MANARAAAGEVVSILSDVGLVALCLLFYAIGYMTRLVQDEAHARKMKGGRK